MVDVGDETERELSTAPVEEVEAIHSDVPTDTKIVENDEVAAGIVHASSDHEMMIIGATRDGFLQLLVFGTIPETVGREADGTVIMAKRNLGISSRIRRVFSRA